MFTCGFRFLQRLIACKQEVCTALPLDAESLELSMGMSADFEHAVNAPFWVWILSPGLLGTQTAICTTVFPFLLDWSWKHKRPSGKHHIWSSRMTLELVEFPSSGDSKKSHVENSIAMIVHFLWFTQVANVSNWNGTKNYWNSGVTLLSGRPEPKLILWQCLLDFLWYAYVWVEFIDAGHLVLHTRRQLPITVICLPVQLLKSWRKSCSIKCIHRK